jgi:hypothetical protein
MAGKNQHYIPKLLLRGFKIPGQKTELVVRYRRGLPQQQVSIDNICFGKYFYSDLTDTSLDNRITAEESAAFGPALDAVRKGKSTDEQVLRRFIVHLMLRTQAARSNIEAVANAAGQGFIEALSDKSIVARMVRSGAIDVKKTSKRALDDGLKQIEKALPRRQRLLIQKRAEDYLKTHIDQAARFVAATTAQYAPGALADRLSGEHLQKEILAQDIAPPNQVASLDRMKLTIVDYDASEPLILGDDPVLGFLEDATIERAFMPLRKPAAYVLPVMPTRAILLHSSAMDFLYSARVLNEASSALSHHQFVARTATSANADLVVRIGSYVDPIHDVNWKNVAIGHDPWG